MYWGGDSENITSVTRSSDDARGEMEVVGIVLLIGFVLIGATSVVVVGSSAMDQLQGSSQDAAAEQSLVTTKTELSSLRTNDTTAVSVSEPVSANTYVDPTAGNLTIITDDGTEYNTTFGTITYERGDRKMAYQGGGVWEHQGGTATMISRPNVGLAGDTDAPTIHFDVTSLRGEKRSGNDLTVRSAGTNESIAGIPQRLPRGETTIEIESTYYEAWGQLLEEYADVTYVHSEEKAIGTVHLPNESTVENSLAVDGQLVVGGGIGVTSFDSRSSPGGGSVGTRNYAETGNGDVFVTDGFDGHGSASVNGDLYVDGDFTVDGGSDIDGDIYATGDVTIKTDEITETVVAGGDVIVDRGGVSFTDGSEVRTEGELTDYGSGNTYAGLVHVGGDFTADEHGWNTLADTGEIRAGGDIAIDDDDNGGDKIHGVAPPSTSELDQIAEIADGMPVPEDEVDDAVDMYEADNDNADLGNIGGQNANDVITAGNYYHDGDLSYGGSPSLTFDTTDGNINLVVDGDIDAQSIDADIDGDGRVRIYTTGNFETRGGATWTNDHGAGDRLWIYTAESDADTYIGGEFYGVVLSESEVELNGGANVYGAIVTEDGDITGGQNIYYDEAIADAEFGDESVTEGIYRDGYIDVSATELIVEDG